MAGPTKLQGWWEQPRFNTVRSMLDKINTLIGNARVDVEALTAAGSTKRATFHHGQQLETHLTHIHGRWEKIRDVFKHSGCESLWHEFPGLQNSIDQVHAHNFIPEDVLKGLGLRLPTYPSPGNLSEDLERPGRWSKSQAADMLGEQRRSRSPPRDHMGHGRQARYRERSPNHVHHLPHANGGSGYIPLGPSDNADATQHEASYMSRHSSRQYATPDTRKGHDLYARGTGYMDLNLHVPRRPERVAASMFSDGRGFAEEPLHPSMRGLSVHPDHSLYAGRSSAHPASPAWAPPQETDRSTYLSSRTPPNMAYQDQVDTGYVGITGQDSGDWGLSDTKGPVRSGSTPDRWEWSDQGMRAYLGNEGPKEEGFIGVEDPVRSGRTSTSWERQPLDTTRSMGNWSSSRESKLAESDGNAPDSQGQYPGDMEEWSDVESLSRGCPSRDDRSIRSDRTETLRTQDPQGMEASSGDEYTSVKSEAGPRLRSSTQPAQLDISNVTRSSMVPLADSLLVQQRIHIAEAWSQHVSHDLEAARIEISRRLTCALTSTVESELAQGRWNIHPLLLCVPFLGGGIMNSTLASAWEIRMKQSPTIHVGPISELVDTQSIIATRGVLREDNRAIPPAALSCQKDGCMLPEHMFIREWSPGAPDTSNCRFIHEHPVETMAIPLYCPDHGQTCRPASAAISEQETVLACWLYSRGYTSLDQAPLEALTGDNIPREIIHATLRIFELRVDPHDTHGRVYAFFSMKFKIRDYIRNRVAFYNPPSAQRNSDEGVDAKDAPLPVDSRDHQSLPARVQIKEDSAMDDSSPTRSPVHLNLPPQSLFDKDSPMADSPLAKGPMRQGPSSQLWAGRDSPVADGPLGPGGPMPHGTSPSPATPNPERGSQIIQARPASHPASRDATPQPHPIPPADRRRGRRFRNVIPDTDSSAPPSSSPGPGSHQDARPQPIQGLVPGFNASHPAPPGRFSAEMPFATAQEHTGQQAGGPHTSNTQHHQTNYTPGMTLGDITKLLDDAEGLIGSSVQRRLSDKRQSELDAVQMTCLDFWLESDSAKESFEVSSRAGQWTDESPECILCVGPYHASIPEGKRYPTQPFSQANKRTRGHKTGALYRHIQQHKQAEHVQAKALLAMIDNINWLRMEFSKRNSIDTVVEKLAGGQLPQLE